MVRSCLETARNTPPTFPPRSSFRKFKIPGNPPRSGYTFIGAPVNRTRPGKRIKMHGLSRKEGDKLSWHTRGNLRSMTIVRSLKFFHQILFKLFLSLFDPFFGGHFFFPFAKLKKENGANFSLNMYQIHSNSSFRSFRPFLGFGGRSFPSARFILSILRKNSQGKRDTLII